VSNPNQLDCDNDNIGDLCDPARGPGCPDVQDADNDGVVDLLDNCPTTYNPSQANADGDAFGDACDICINAANHTDSDNDGYFGCANDCNDTNDNTYPGAQEICDNQDNDCDSSVDEGGVCAPGYTPPPPPPYNPPGYISPPGQPPSQGYQPIGQVPIPTTVFDLDDVLKKIKDIRVRLNSITNNLAKLREYYKGQAEENKYSRFIFLTSTVDTDYRNLLIYINQNKNNPSTLNQIKQKIRDANQKSILLNEIYQKI